MFFFFLLFLFSLSLRASYYYTHRFQGKINVHNHIKSYASSS